MRPITYSGLDPALARKFEELDRKLETSTGKQSAGHLGVEEMQVLGETSSIAPYMLANAVDQLQRNAPDARPELEALLDRLNAQVEARDPGPPITDPAELAALRDRAAQARAANPAFGSYLTTLLLGEPVARVLFLLRQDLAGYQGNVKLLQGFVDKAQARSSFNHSGRPLTPAQAIGADRASSLKSWSARCAQLEQAIDLVGQLDRVEGWQGWFASDPSLPSVEERHAELHASITALVAELAPGRGRPSLAQAKAILRRALAAEGLEPSEQQLDQMAPIVQAAAKDRPRLVSLLALLIDLSVELDLRVLRQPGGAFQHRAIPYSGAISYDYSALPQKNIHVMRNEEAKPHRRGDPMGAIAAHYDFSASGATPGQISGGPWVATEPVVTLFLDGRVARGARYEQFLGQFGVELPDRVAPEEVRALVRVVDAALSADQRAADLSLAIRLLAASFVAL